MSQESVEVVKVLMDAVNRRDIDTYAGSRIRTYLDRAEALKAVRLGE